MNNGYVIRYGTSRLVGEFSANAEKQFSRGDEVIVRSSRGVEWGEVLCLATERTREYLGSSDSAGRIVRPVNEQDAARREEIAQQEPQQFAGVRDTIAEHKLQMQLVDIEHLFGGERLIVYYLAEQRVDFRQLVKTLAKQFKTRIEMRQIGVRDEAKLLADYGDCGKPVCCNTHLREMPPVAMKMAKIQKATLDPTKISGRCGRLKCCLRYEYDTYEEYRRELPRVGATVVTKEGKGRVVGQEILARKVLVVYEDQRRMLVDGNSILTVIKSTGGGKKDSASLN